MEFKSKGNEGQFVFNEGLEDWLIDSSKHLKKLADAIPAALPDPPEALTGAVTKAKKSQDEGMALIAHHQKLIKLADCSKHGWKVVKEYESDVLAENKENSKGQEGPNKVCSCYCCQEKKVSPKSQPAIFSTKLHSSSSKLVNIGGPEVLNPRPIGPCFRCGEMGHLQNSCPSVFTVSSQ